MRRMRLLIKVFVFVLVFCCLGVLLSLSLLSQRWLQAMGFGIGMAVFLFGIKLVHEEERFVIEFLRSFWKIKGPGLIWIFPLLMKIRAVVSIWEQSVDLFLEKPSIDFRGGGTAQLIGPKVWLKIEEAHRAVYNIANWREAVRARIENLMRDFLSNKSVEEIIDQESIHPWWSLIKKDLQAQEPPENPEQEILDAWGIKVTKITIEDFQWSEEVVRTRKDVFEAQREIEREKNLASAAKHKARKRAQESGGMHGEIVNLLINSYGYSRQGAEEVATRLVEYYKGSEEKVLRDWRGGALESILERFGETIKLAKQ